MKDKTDSDDLPNHENHAWVLEHLKKAQDADHDNREQVREAKLFTTKRDGQWESYWWNVNDGRPRFSFDMTNPIIDQIAGYMERSDFDIKISPAGNDATKDIAETYDGLVRNIEKMSNAVQVFNSAGRSMVVGGLAGWRVVQEYVDGDSFDQDLIIKRVGNFEDRVWFGPFEEPDASDADYGWVLSGLLPEDFKTKYPEATEGSVGSDRTGTAYYHRQDLEMVGEFLYVKEEPIELVLMTNNEIYEADAEFDKIVDELLALGITERKRRKRMKRCVYSREFSTQDWLTDARKTVFEEWLPIVPAFANFDIVEEKVVYYGAVEKIIDAQRVYNYSQSREIEEGALAPRAKYWMTSAQVKGHTDTLATLNTNSDPVQIFNPDQELPGPPQQNGGATINPGLRTISEGMKAVINQSAGMFSASMGDNPFAQSGVAIDKLQDKGDTGNNKYSTAREIAQRHTARILVKAIPKVYGPGRQVRILDEDGSFDMATIGEVIIDQQTGEEVTLNDLSVGKYDVACSSGPSFKNRQNETVRALTEVGKVDPSVIQLGGDILLNNIPAPGMRSIGERKRNQLFQQGLIPEDQWTDEEKQKVQEQQQAAQNQPPQQDPMEIAAQAEAMKGQADMLDAQTKQQESQFSQQERMEKLKIDTFNAETSRISAETKRIEVESGIRKKTADAEGSELDNFAKVEDIRNAPTKRLMEVMQGGLSGN